MAQSGHPGYRLRQKPVVCGSVGPAVPDCQTILKYYNKIIIMLKHIFNSSYVHIWSQILHLNFNVNISSTYAKNGKL
jgi:hypothetical protein